MDRDSCLSNTNVPYATDSPWGILVWMAVAKKRSRTGTTQGSGDSFFIRQCLSLTPRELAHILGCSHVTVYRWEDGKHAPPEGLYGIVLSAVAAKLRRFRAREGADVVPFIEWRWSQMLRDGLLHEVSPVSLLDRFINPPEPPAGQTWSAVEESEASQYFDDEPPWARRSETNEEAPAAPAAAGRSERRSSKPAGLRRHGRARGAGQT